MGKLEAGETMTPSKEAIEAALDAVPSNARNSYFGIALAAAYTIDFAALQQQLENVTKERNNFWKFYTNTQQEIERLKECLLETTEYTAVGQGDKEPTEIEEENKRLKSELTVLRYRVVRLECVEKSAIKLRTILRSIVESLKDVESRLTWIADSGDCSMSDDSVVECRGVRDDIKDVITQAKEMLK